MCMRNFTNLSSYLKPSTACRRIKSRDCIQSTKYLFSPILECSILKEKVKTISGNNSNCSFAIVSNKSPITITFNSFTIRILPTSNSWRSWDCLSILCSGSYRKFNEFRVGSIHICNDFQRVRQYSIRKPFIPPLPDMPTDENAPSEDTKCSFTYTQDGVLQPLANRSFSFLQFIWQKTKRNSSTPITQENKVLHRFRFFTECTFRDELIFLRYTFPEVAIAPEQRCQEEMFHFWRTINLPQVTINLHRGGSCKNETSGKLIS